MPDAAPRTSIPCVTAKQMRAITRRAVEEYGGHERQMREHAGWHCAQLARGQFLDGDVRDRTVLVVSGPGRNGRDGLAAARHLHNWGASVWVATTAPPRAHDDGAARQIEQLRRMDVPVEPVGATADLPAGADLLIDALVGTGPDGMDDEERADRIHQIIWQGAPVLSLDVPSGLDATTGVPSQNTVHADATLTLALPKCGLDAPAARSAVGDLFLADIGIPPALYEALDLNGTVDGLFSAQDRIRIR